ncbi:MAG: hypothetical protein NT133_05065 [Alphaproteobacteria bacterium]|nr:hypothetical protein [Alphaproteobacteria bacterium]
MFTELQSGLGALLIASPIQRDAVAMLYSPVSFRMQWLRDHRARGDAWTRRSSELEGEDNALRTAMREAAGTLQACGIVPQWLTPEILAAGALRRGVRVLVLPQVLALSDGEASEIAAFRAAGGVVVAIGETGVFDEQGRARPAPVIHFQPRDLQAALTEAGAVPLARLPASLARQQPPTLTVRRNGEVLLLGIADGRDGPSAALDTHRVELNARRFVRDLRADGGWVETATLDVSLNGDGAAMFALAPAPLPAPVLRAPASLRAGDTARIAIALAGPTPAAATVLHVTLRDPAGKVMRIYGGNAVLRGGGLIWVVPFALDDAPGDWNIAVHDVLGGGTATGRITLAVP